MQTFEKQSYLNISYTCFSLCQFQWAYLPLISDKRDESCTDGILFNNLSRTSLSGPKHWTLIQTLSVETSGCADRSMLGSNVLCSLRLIHSLSAGYKTAWQVSNPHQDSYGQMSLIVHFWPFHILLGGILAQLFISLNGDWQLKMWPDCSKLLKVPQTFKIK